MKITIEIDSHEYDGEIKGWYLKTTRDGVVVNEDYAVDYDPLDLSDKVGCEVLRAVDPDERTTPEEQVDEFGWPIRTFNDSRLCARPGCRHDEFRIKGYCSVYCKDVHVEMLEAEELRTHLVQAQKEVGRWRSDYDAARAEVEELRGLLREARDRLREAAELKGEWIRYGGKQGEWRFMIGKRQAATVWPNGTWHTWNEDGVGGYNDAADSPEQAKWDALAALRHQGWDESLERKAALSAYAQHRDGESERRGEN